MFSSEIQIHSYKEHTGVHFATCENSQVVPRGDSRRTLWLYITMFLTLEWHLCSCWTPGSWARMRRQQRRLYWTRSCWYLGSKHERLRWLGSMVRHIRSIRGCCTGILPSHLWLMFNFRRYAKRGRNSIIPHVQIRWVKKDVIFIRPYGWKLNPTTWEFF